GTVSDWLTVISRGVLHTGNGSFGIEPLEASTSYQHLVYRLEDVLSEPLKCGTPHSESQPDHDHDHDLHAVPISQLFRAYGSLMYVIPVLLLG
ncbi:hypothetical protein JZ751_001485, partial [Albula glossodonta]